MVLTHEFDVYHNGMTNTVHHGLHGSAMHRQKQGNSLHPSVPRFDPTVAGFRPNDMERRALHATSNGHAHIFR